MNTRKASLRKLRLPGSIGSKGRNGHQTITTAISNYFANEGHSEKAVATVDETVYSSATPSPVNAINTEETAVTTKIQSCAENDVEFTNNVETTVYSGEMPSTIEVDEETLDKAARVLRTKLSTFLPKEKRLKTEKKRTHDFDTPKKTIKKAPKTKSKTVSKKQQNIKTAFLKHEELFSEVTIQHCLVDNVNPDEMQMAIALSRSEAEVSMTIEEVQLNEEKENDQNEGIREKLRQFGFRVAESEDYNLTAFMPTKSKSKWANKFTALTLRNPQRQLSKINQRIEHIVGMEFATGNTSQNDEITTYCLKSKALVQLRAKGQSVIRFSTCETSDLIEFYVLSLFEPTLTKAGHLLKDVRRIAGREPSPEKVVLGAKDFINDALLNSPVVKRSRCDEIISSSCPFPTRDLINGFDTAGKQSETFHEIQFMSNDIEALKEVTSISLNVMNVTNAEKISDDYESPRKAISNKKSLSTFINAAETATSPLRCTSPDIFADSDTDGTTDECEDIRKQMNTSGSSVGKYHITTYEIFSSDEVKTFSVTREDGYTSLSPTTIVDLTQCGSDSSSQPSQKDVKQGEEYKECTTEYLYSSLGSLAKNDDLKTLEFVQTTIPGHHSLGKMGTNSFGSSVSEECNIFNSISKTESDIPIDLTQNDDEEDDCILLSDDEVNYSMWQSKKTNKYVEGTHRDANADVSCYLNEKFDTQRGKGEFSFVELVAGSQSLPPTQSDEFDGCIAERSTSSLNFETDLDLSKQFGLSTSEEDCPFKTPTKTPRHSPKTTPGSKSPKGLLLPSPVNRKSPNTSRQTDFEPLDEQSPFKTPTKTQTDTPLRASSKCRKALSNTFKSSPSSPENFIKCNTNTYFSNDELDLDLSKRSDFGILDEQSPFKTPTGTPKKTPRKTQSSASPRCRKALSESFLLSPGERVTPIKRFSSINKFTEFTKNNDENLSDYDEIDKLIYGSPLKKAYKKPAGLDQLLNGPINTEPQTPPKSEPDSPKEFVFNGRTYLVRTANVSQMPDYQSMDEASLLKQLFKYGIRRLKRKQALKVLEYIFKQTHPCLIETNESPAKRTQALSEDENGVNEENFPNDEISNTNFKFNLRDCWGHLLVSDTAVNMEIEDEQYIVQTNISKKISTALLPFHIAWYNLLKSNKELHEAILHYEPIDLQEIFLFFKRLGYRYDPKELKYFFDSRSIIFRYDLNKGDPSTGSNRHARKRPYKATRTVKGRTKLG